MKILSIDIETTGLDPQEHKVIEFGCILEDIEKNHIPIDELPYFHCIIIQEKRGDHVAIEMNKELFELMPEYGISQAEFLKTFYEWCIMNNLEIDENRRVRIIAAGKNFAGFDNLFLNEIPGFKHFFSISNRVIDPALLYMLPEDKEVPDLQTCLIRAGINIDVKHTALDDAKDIIYLLRQKYKSLNLIPDQQQPTKN